MQMRPAGEADWPDLWPIWHGVVRAGDTYTFAPDTRESEARSLWMLPPPAETWLAAIDGVVAGTYLLKPNQPGLGAHVANAGFMVARAARGRGVGRAMAVHCLDRARELGYLAMQFNAVVATNTSAVALWERLGFTVIGTVPLAFRHAELGLVDLRIMHRFL